MLERSAVVWHCAVRAAHQLKDLLENTDEAEIPRIKLYTAFQKHGQSGNKLVENPGRYAVGD